MQPAPSTQPTTPPRPRGRVRWPGRVGLAVVAATSISLLLGSVQAHNLVTTITDNPDRRVDIRPGKGGNDPKAATKHDALNILLLGVDSREGLSEAEIDKYKLGHEGLGGADTMMLVHLSSERDHATIISFPRDLYVTIPAFSRRSDGKEFGEVKMKLNAAFPRGGGSKGDGPALTVKTIEQLTDLHIDHYMSIDVPQLGRLVDDLDGVNVCLPKAVKDKNSGLNLPAGKSHLDGVQAVAYVRARHINTGEGSEDFGRMRRQQKFLGAMMAKLTSSGTVLNLGKMQKVVNTVAGALTMDEDLKSEDLLRMASQLKGLNPKKVTFATVPFADDNYRVEGVGSTVRIDEAAAASLFDAIREDRLVGSAATPDKVKALKPAEVSVQVLNGGAPTGSARGAADALAALGFLSAGEPRNADTRGLATTTIRYPSSEAAAAKTVKKFVPGATLQQDDAATTVELILGADYKGSSSIGAAAPTAPAKAVQTHTAADNPCK